MRLSLKLILAMLFVAAIPFGFAGFHSLSLSRAEVEERIHEILAKTSLAEAEIIGRDITDVIRSLRLLAPTLQLDTQDLANLSESITRVYLLSDRFRAAVLLGELGEQIGPAIFVDDLRSFPEQYQQHEEMDQRELSLFLSQVRSNWPPQEGCSTHSVYDSQDHSKVMMTCQTSVWVHGKKNYLAVELSLRDMLKRFQRFRVGRSGFAFLLDPVGNIIFHPKRPYAFGQKTKTTQTILSSKQGQPSWVLDYSDRDLGKMVGAVAIVPKLDWSVVVAQSKQEALQPVQKLWVQLVSWFLAGLVLACMLGLFLSSRIVKPVRELVNGALAIANGKLEHKIHVRSKDEIGRLSAAFNHMGHELSKHRQQIEYQTEEIKRWNLELQKRVDERTHELKLAQDQLIQAQKMAAIGELGAGVAHEINNPLMGVIGCAQLLLMRHAEGDRDHVLLLDIEREGQRIREIVNSLLQASQLEGDSMARVDLSNLIYHVVAVLREELTAKSIRVEVDIPPEFPLIMGNTSRLEECLVELIRNASHAMPEGGTVRIVGSGVEGELVKLEIRDSGVGIAKELHKRIFEPFFTTKQNWYGKGLGLSKVFQIINQHSAQIQVDSQEGHGANFAITFPALRKSLHLR